MGIALAAAVIGIISPFDGSAATLARLDPVSLRPTGPRVRLGEYHDAWAFSPDGSQLALGNGGQGRVCGRGVCVVDVREMAVSSSIAMPIAVEALAWVRPRRVVAVLQRGGVAALMTGSPLRLVVAGATGAVRVAGLRRIRSGVNGSPGLAVDRRGRRAFVVAARAPVAEVDLRTMRVDYHRVAPPRPRRARGFKSREALWLGKGLVAVFGDDSPSTPAGVRIVDTSTWTARTVDARAGRATFTAGRLLVYSSSVRARGVGLRVYSRDGRRLISHVLANQSLDVEVAGARACAYRTSGRRRALHIVEARSGQIVRTTRPPPREHEVDILGR